MIRRLARRLRRNERGVSMLEFAIAIPVLLALIFGILEFAWILHGHITLTGAAREGVRQAVVSEYTGKTDSEIKAVIINHARTFELTEGDIAIGAGNNDKEIEVKINDAQLPLLTGLIGQNYVVNEVTATMMVE